MTQQISSLSLPYLPETVRVRARLGQGAKSEKNRTNLGNLALAVDDEKRQHQPDTEDHRLLIANSFKMVSPAIPIALVFEIRIQVSICSFNPCRIFD